MLLISRRRQYVTNSHEGAIVAHSRRDYFVPVKECEVLRYYISPKTTVLVLSNFLHMLNTVVARFVTDGNAIGYVKFGFVVDVMFSHNGANGPESKTTRVLRPVRQMAAPKAKSGVCYCISLS